MQFWSHDNGWKAGAMRLEARAVAADALLGRT
jgi:hypothetical protein